MDINDLWIGDRLIIKSSGKVGTYEGINKGKVRVKVGTKIILVRATNIMLAPEKPVEDPDLGLGVPDTNEHPKKKSPPKKTIRKEIDLHLEKLPPFENTRWQTALEYQIDTCKRFLDEAIEAKTPCLLIVHGKGKGILKKEILHMLDDYSAVYLKLEVNQGGAIEVWMQY